MRKNVAKRKARKTGVTKKKSSAKVRRVKPAKIFIYALALAALGGGGYLVYDRMKRKKFAEQNNVQKDQDTIINNNLPASFASSSSRSSSSSSNTFPLKRGSRGSRVTALQQALAKIIGTAAMNANGGIDGQFGSGTANALKMAGYPEVIDEMTFNKITGNSGHSPKNNHLLI